MVILELEAPEAIEQSPTALHQDPPAAVSAAELLDAGDGGEEDAAAEPTMVVVNVKPLPTTHEDAAKRRADYMLRKDILQERICALGIEQGKLKEQAKLCKKESEVLLEQLDQLIESYENPPVPAAGTETAAEPTAGRCGFIIADQSAEDTQQTEPVSRPVDPVAKESAYRAALEDATVAELDIGEKVREKLIEAGAATLWSLEQFRADIALGKKDWPKGVGEAKQSQIEDAILRWMADHSDCWDQVQGENDRIEAAADSERAAEVAESQPPLPPVSLDDL